VVHVDDCQYLGPKELPAALNSNHQEQVKNSVSIQSTMAIGWPENMTEMAYKFAQKNHTPFDPNDPSHSNFGPQEVLARGTITNSGTKVITKIELAFSLRDNGRVIFSRSQYWHMREIGAYSDTWKRVLDNPLPPGGVANFESFLPISPKEFMTREAAPNFTSTSLQVEVTGIEFGDNP
jgi:hypothetical protein